MFDKILIANRGEIACRVMRTCKRMGVKTVAVYSDADRFSKHVQMADEAVHLGASQASESYLSAEKILKAALRTGAQAIHPGYGFLSENADFAQYLEESKKVTFIGPPASAIRSMGSKAGSKRIMTAAGVPCTPGYHGEDQSMERLKVEAERCGFPLMLKADAGGGGKGMRIVENMGEFEEKAASCRREAMASFKDDKILMERYVREGRHVEFQVFGDKHGNYIHLFERDCSVQRRHQKVLEEAPAPNLNADLRKAMGEAAVQAAKAVGYVGAGTIEFLLDADDPKKSFYFMEMNTRLQVEHPVTEMVTGLDLVELQLRVASGEKLPLRQSDVKISGHSLEARIYAENPAGGFLPGSGPLKYVREPRVTDGNVRVETGVGQGDQVSIYYDPMIAKLVVRGETRADALKRMEMCLDEYKIAGLSTNIQFVSSCVKHPEFQQGGVTTKFISKNQKELLPEDTDLNFSHDEGRLLGAALAAARALDEIHQSGADNDLSDTWFRIGQGNGVTKTFDISLPHNPKERHAIRATLASLPSAKHNQILLSVVRPNEANNAVQATANLVSRNPHDGETVFDLEVDGSRVPGLTSWFNVNDKTGERTLNLFTGGKSGFSRLHYQVNFLNPDFTRADASGKAAGSSVNAPMPGKVTKVLVKPGDNVEQGQPLLLMEAMKMEHSLKSPKSGKVSEVLAREGDLVSDSQELIKVA